MRRSLINKTALLALSLLLVPVFAEAAPKRRAQVIPAPVGDSYAPAFKPSAPPGEPPILEDLLGLTAPKNMNPIAEKGLQLRAQAMREAALSFGARAGLARRSYEINKGLELRAEKLDRIYNFRGLLIAAPSGLLIEPPVVTEADDLLKIEDEGQTAAVADAMYKINARAKIVAAGRDWRDYLTRDWSQVDPPPPMLLPRKSEESKDWAAWIAEGWKAGYEQADDIFQADLDRMTRDFTGQVRYRQLLAQGMISAPFALQEDRGVTGGGDEMRVGDRAVAITGPARLEPKAERWNAVPR